MGNLCGKSSSEDHFATPGRRLGDAPPRAAASTAPVPKQRIAAGGPGQTLGGGGGAPSSQGDSNSAADEARRKAAAAAEARAAPPPGKAGGKLGQKLAAQKKQTQSETLKSASEAQRRQREIDSNADALSHN